MSVILGINAFHPDSSACLIVNSVVRSAISEERLGARDKHTNAFPINAINFVLEDNNYSLSDIDHVAFSHDAKKEFKGEVSIRNIESIFFNIYYSKLYKKFSRSQNFKKEFKQKFKSSKRT